MNLRTFFIHVLPVVSGLFLGALLLSSCDSGPNLSSIDDPSASGAPVAKVRAWYDDHIQTAFSGGLVSSGGLAKTSADVDSLTLAAFVEKFPPDWDTAILLSSDDGRKTMATTLGQYTDEKYEENSYHVRTILFDLDASRNVESGTIIVFSSHEKLYKDNFHIYMKQYLENDYRDVDMMVSRYTTLFEPIDAFAHRPGQAPLELSIGFSETEITPGALGKLGSTDPVINYSVSSPPCYRSCYFVLFGWTCTGNLIGGPPDYSDPGNQGCRPHYYINCVSRCFGSSGSGSGSPPTGVNPPGGNEEEEEDECDYTEKICDLIEEYEDIGVSSSRIPSANSFSTHLSGEFFTWRELNGGWSDGSEYGAHKPYGIFSSSLLSDIDEMRRVYGPISLSSGYRCPQGNTDVGSRYRTTSKHMFGRAVDMRTGNNATVFNRLNTVRARVAPHLRWEPMSSYSDGHLHLQL